WRAALAVLNRFDAVCAAFAPKAQEELKRRRAERPDNELDNDKGRRAEAFQRRLLTEKATGYGIQRLLMRCSVAPANARNTASKRAAAELLDKLAEAAGRGLELALFLAEGFAAVGQPERAMPYLRRLLLGDKDHWQAMGLEARLHHAARRDEDAVNCAA